MSRTNSNKNTRINKQANTNVQTETNLEPPTSRMKLGANSLPSLNHVQGLIYEEARRELRFPKSSAIYKQMALDSNIASALALIEAIITSIDWKIECPKDASDFDRDVMEKLNYNMLIMDRPFNEYISEFLSFLMYGFAPSEKIYTKWTGLPVGDFKGWKDFRTVSQDTVGKWLFDNTSGDLVGLEQDLSKLLTGSYTINRGGNGSQKQELPRKKFMLFRYNPKRNNPEGNSPLKSSYITWKYRSVIEEFETIYATKGLGGVLDLGIDVAYLAKAAADPTGDEATVVEALKGAAQNFHNGDSSYTITPLAYDERGKALFHTKILETNPPNTNDIVKRHDHRMLMTFFADVLSLGADGSGSLALSGDKKALLMVGIEQHLKNIQSTLNHDLIKQTYELNKWPYDARKACRFVYDDVNPDSLDDFSKAVQRVMAVGSVQHTDDIEDAIRGRVFNLPTMGVAKPEIRVVDSIQSRSGDGMESGLPNGVGDALNDGKDSSVDNAESA